MAATAGELWPAHQANSATQAVGLFARLETYFVLLTLFIFATGGNYLTPGMLAHNNGSETATSAQAATGMLHSVELLVGLALSFFLALSIWRSIVLMWKRMIVFSLLAVLTTFSAAWSRDPVLSLRSGIYLSLNTLFCFYLARRYTTRQLMQILMALGCVVFVLSILTAAALPAYGITAGGGHIALQGVFIAKNLMGNMAVLLLTPALFMRPIRRSRRALYVCLMLLLIVLSFSVQAWAATLLCFGFAFQRTMSRRLRGRDMAWLFYVAVVPALAAFAFLLAYWTDTLQFLGKDPTLSGRTVIWDAVLKSIAKKPFLGWGFNAFWQGFTGESANVAMEVHFFIAQAQNGLLEVLLEVGGVGALLVISSFVQAFRHFFKTSRSAEPDNVDWYILIVILTMFYSLGEADLLGQNSVPWMLYILACCGLALCANPIGRPRGAPRLV